MSTAAHDLSHLYQQDKAALHGLSPQRRRLAQREMDTLALLLSEAGRPLPADAHVLDLGCGDRFLASATQARGLRYTGLDVDSTDFEQDRLPLPDQSVDVALSLAVIEHLRDPSQFLREIHRCLKPGGVVYLSTPNFRYDFRNFYNDPTHRQPYTPESLEALLKLFGYAGVATFPGLRCKPAHWYRGPLRFWRAYHLLPFRGDARWAPGFLKGHVRSVFALGFKPEAGHA